MTKLEALKDLAAKVEAGEFDADPKEARAPKFNGFMSAAENALGLYEPVGLAGLAWRTYNGSLDAAKALHEAVLPGWGWEISSDGFVTVSHPTDPWRGHWPDANLSNPARAWLLAILKALIAQEEGK